MKIYFSAQANCKKGHVKYKGGMGSIGKGDNNLVDEEQLRWQAGHPALPGMKKGAGLNIRVPTSHSPLIIFAYPL